MREIQRAGLRVNKVTADEQTHHVVEWLEEAHIIWPGSGSGIHIAPLSRAVYRLYHLPSERN